MRTEFECDRQSWDSFVEQAAPDRLYHLWDWLEIVKDTFGHPVYRLSAIEHGRIRGVLPLVSIRSRLFGHFLVSIPFFTYGGILADSDEARKRLIDDAGELAQDLGVRHVELRQGAAFHTTWREVTPKVTM